MTDCSFNHSKMSPISSSMPNANNIPVTVPSWSPPLFETKIQRIKRIFIQNIYTHTTKYGNSFDLFSASHEYNIYILCLGLI